MNKIERISADFRHELNGLWEVYKEAFNKIEFYRQDPNSKSDMDEINKLLKTIQDTAKIIYDVHPLINVINDTVISWLDHYDKFARLLEKLENNTKEENAIDRKNDQ